MKEKKELGVFGTTLIVVLIAIAITIGAFAVHNSFVKHQEANNTTETETTTVETEDTAVTRGDYYDIPLSHEFQDYVIEMCRDKGISPKLIFAIIERESSYRQDCIGDNGDSFGLMQIQPKWNQERMDRLGVTNLLDPYSNVKVGIDLVEYLCTKNDNVAWVLMAYNGGEWYASLMEDEGKVNSYATDVLSILQTL